MTEKQRLYIQKTNRSDASIRRAWLSKEEYLDLLELWQEGGKDFLTVKNYRRELTSWRKRLSPRRNHRREFVINLGRDVSCWRDLILSEQRRGGADRGRVSDLLDKAENDPLRFHNLSGVSPYDILAIIDQQYERQVNYEALSKKLRSLSEREADAKQLRKAVRMLKCYKPLLIDRWWPVTDMFGRLESFAEILDDKELKGLVPPWNLDPKGPRAKNELSEITREMMELVEEQKKCLEHLATGKVDKSRLLDVTTGAKAQWGSVTAVLMAAFPQWFSRKIDPIRNVKIAFKRFPKYSEPVDEDM